VAGGDANAPDITNNAGEVKESLKNFFAGTLFNLAHEKLIREFAARITQRGYAEGYKKSPLKNASGEDFTAEDLLSQVTYTPDLPGFDEGDAVQFTLSEDINTGALEFYDFIDEPAATSDFAHGSGKSFFHSPTLRKLDKALVPNISAEQVCNPKGSAPRSLLGIDKIIEQSMEDYEKMACIPNSSGVPPVKRALINGVIRCFFRTIACEYALRNVFMLAKYPMDEVFKNNVVLKYFANAIIKDFYNQTRWSSKYPQFLRLFMQEVNRMFKDLEANIPKGQSLLHPLTKEPIVVKTDKQKLAYLMAEQIPSMSETLKEVINTSLGGYTFTQNNIEKDFLNAIPHVEIADIIKPDYEPGGTYTTRNRFYKEAALDKEAGGTFSNRLTELGRQFFTDPEALEDDKNVNFLQGEGTTVGNHGGFILEKYIYIDPEGVDGEENGKLVNSSIYGATEKWAPDPTDTQKFADLWDDVDFSEFSLWERASLVGKCSPSRVKKRMEEFLDTLIESGGYPKEMQFSALGFKPVKFGYRLSYVLPSLEDTASSVYEQAQKDLDSFLMSDTGDPGAQLGDITPLEIQGQTSGARDSVERAAFLSKAYKLTERQVVLGAGATAPAAGDNPATVVISEKEVLKKTYYILPLIDIQKEADNLPNMTLEEARDNFPIWKWSNKPSWSSGTGPEGPNNFRKLMRMHPKYKQLIGQDPENAIFNVNRVASLVSLYTSTSMNNIPALNTLFDATKEALVMLFFTALRDTADFTAEDPYETACAQGVPPFPATALSGFPFNLMALFYSTPLKMIAGIVSLIDPGYKKYKDNGSDFNFTPFGKHPYAFPYTPMGWVLVFLDFSWFDDMAGMFDSDKKNSELCDDDNVISSSPIEEVLADVISDEEVAQTLSELDLATILADIEEDPFNATFKHGIDPALPWLSGDTVLSIQAGGSIGDVIFIEKDGKYWPPQEYGCEELLLLRAFYEATAKEGKEALEEIIIGSSGNTTAYTQLLVIVAKLLQRMKQLGCYDLMTESAWLVYDVPPPEDAEGQYHTYKYSAEQTLSTEAIYANMKANGDVITVASAKNWSQAFFEGLYKTCEEVYGENLFWGKSNISKYGDPEQGCIATYNLILTNFSDPKTKYNLKLAAKMRAVQLGYNAPSEKAHIKSILWNNVGTPSAWLSADLWGPLSAQDPDSDAPWLTNEMTGPDGKEFTVGPWILSSAFLELSGHILG
jgi:hypothetical protein